MFELDFLPVGQSTKSGDAICMRVGNTYTGFTIHVVDGGYTETGDVLVEHINDHYGRPTHISTVLLTHPDTDHVSGLFKVLETYNVGTLYMHRPWLHAAEIIHHFHGNWTVDGLTRHLKEQFSVLVDLEALAISKGTSVVSPFQGTAVGPLTVLAPSRQRYLDLLVQLPNTPAQVKARKTSVFSQAAKLAEEFAKAALNWIRESWGAETLSNNPEPTTPSNETSVVQAGILDGKKVLLTGDVGPVGLAEAYAYAQQLGFGMPDLVQVPHHGSRRNVTPSTLNAWLGTALPEGWSTRGYAICSASENDTDHPKKVVENAFLRRGYPVYNTKGKLLYYSEGLSRGYSGATPSPFHHTVEA